MKLWSVRFSVKLPVQVQGETKMKAMEAAWTEFRKLLPTLEAGAHIEGVEELVDPTYEAAQDARRG